MKTFFFAILVQPIFNLLVLLYLLVGQNLGWAIVLLTTLIRLALWPLQSKTIKNQAEVGKLQPEVAKIKKKISDPLKQRAEIMKLYQTHKVNPALGCLILLIQLPILIALYQSLLRIGEAGNHLNWIYPFLPQPGHIATQFFIWDLSVPDKWILPLAAAVFQTGQMFIVFIHQKSRLLANIDESDPAQKMQAQAQRLMMPMMAVMLGFMTFYIGTRFPAALMLYWITTTLLMLAQQVIVEKKIGAFKVNIQKKLRKKAK